MLPSQKQLKQEAVLSKISDIREKMVEIARLDKKLKSMKNDMKDHFEALSELMREMDLEDIHIESDVIVESIKPYSYKRFAGVKSIQKKHPEVLELYPDLITTVDVKPHIRLKVIT